jgi:penicillin V acylase-like amidase (Ntn superfamily)
MRGIFIFTMISEKKYIVSGRFALCVLAALTAAAAPAGACTRVAYFGPDKTAVTGRSMDWMISLHTNLWAFPAGVERDGAVGQNSLTWTSKFGSVISAAYDAATADGMNEKGLVANLLYLATADYKARDITRPGLSLAGWTQYVLDNFATVSEAVETLAKEPFQIVAPPIPGGFAPTMHLSISDPTGDSAIFEYLGGKLIIHHNEKYRVMTNEPSYDQQLALNEYWKEIGGSVMLPGTARPADRFVRASYYLNQMPRTSDMVDSVAAMFSIMRNASVPMGVSTAGAPNIAPTLWRTVSDQKNLVYYFESTTSPNVFWVDLTKFNFAVGQPTSKLEVDHGETFSGDAASKFKPAEVFSFIPAKS